MTKKSQIHDLADVRSSLYQLWGIAFGLTLAAVFSFKSLPEFINLMHDDIIHFILSVTLALFTLVLFFAYMIATHIEIGILYDYLSDVMPMPRIGPKIFVITFGLAIVFAALISLSRNLLAYSAVLVAYNLFDLWGSWEVAKTIGKPLEKKLHTTEHDDEMRQGLSLIHGFYFANPTLPRIITMMFVDWIVVCLALSYFFTNEEVLRTCGYVILLLNITSCELIIYRWRRRSIYKLADLGWMSLFTVRR